MEDEVLDVDDLVRLEDFVREVPDVEYLVDLVQVLEVFDVEDLEDGVLEAEVIEDNALADADLDDKEIFMGNLVLVLAVFVVEDLADGVFEVGVIEDEDRVIDNEVLDVEDLTDSILHVDEIIFYNSYLRSL